MDFSLSPKNRATDIQMAPPSAIASPPSPSFLHNIFTSPKARKHLEVDGPFNILSKIDGHWFSLYSMAGPFKRKRPFPGLKATSIYSLNKKTRTKTMRNSNNSKKNILQAVCNHRIIQESEKHQANR